MKGHLGGIDKTADCIILPDHFVVLRFNVVDHMIAHCLDHNVYVHKNNTDQATGGEIEKKDKINTITLDKD